MADEQQQDRTEQATPKRREDARKKGDVPRSRELTMTGVMLASATYILFLSAPIAYQLVDNFKNSFAIERDRIFEPNYMPEALADATVNAAWTLAPFAVVLLIAVFASATLIGGWSFSMKAAAFKAERMSPIKGIKRIFSAVLLGFVVIFLSMGSLVENISRFLDAALTMLPALLSS